MAKKDPSAETTDTILEKLQNTPADYVVMRAGEIRYLLPVPALKLMAWNAIPDMIKDEKSKEAEQSKTLRLGIKALIRPFMPEILKKTWGQEVEITPGLNILSWLPKYFVHYFVAFLASKEWIVHVEKCESCQGDVYKILGISPYTHDSASPDAKALTAARTDSQPVPGRAELDPHRSTDSHQPGGSMGGSGSQTVGKEHLGAGTTETPTRLVSRDENLHSGQFER